MNATVISFPACSPHVLVLLWTVKFDLNHTAVSVRFTEMTDRIGKKTTIYYVFLCFLNYAVAYDSAFAVMETFERFPKNRFGNVSDDVRSTRGFLWHYLRNGAREPFAAAVDELVFKRPKVHKGMLCTMIKNDGRSSVQASGERIRERLPVVYWLSVYWNMICPETVGSLSPTQLPRR